MFIFKGKGANELMFEYVERLMRKYIVLRYHREFERILYMFAEVLESSSIISCEGIISSNDFSVIHNGVRLCVSWDYDYYPLWIINNDYVTYDFEAFYDEATVRLLGSQR